VLPQVINLIVIDCSKLQADFLKVGVREEVIIWATKATKEA